MEFIQIIIIAFAIFSIVGGYGKLKNRRVSFKGFFAWVAVWVAVIIIAVLPETTTFIARFVGIGRGIDVVVYISIILLYYLLFKVYLKLEDLRKNITTVVRELAYRDEKKKK